MIARLLDNRRRQNIFILSLVLLLALGLVLPFTGILKTGLFPEANVDFTIVNVELPPGALLPQTSAKVQEVEEILRTAPEVKSYVANLGSSFSADFVGGGGGGGENLASLFINLHEELARTSFDLSQDLRQELAHIQGAEVSVLEISAGPPTSAPVELRVIGPDFEDLEKLSAELAAELRGVPGAIEVDRNLRFSAGEFSFVFDPTLLATFGVSAQEAAGQLRTYIFGTEATTFLDGANEEVAVRLAAASESVRDVSAIAALPLVTSRRAAIALTS